MPRPNAGGFSIKQRMLKMDWFGILLVCSGLTLFLLGMNSRGNPYEWTSEIVLGTLIAGVFLLTFVLWDWKEPQSGFAHAIFQDRNFNVALLIHISGGLALYGCQAFLP